MKKHIFWLVLSTTLVLRTKPAQANCADTIGTLAYFQPAVERNWNKLQQQTLFPWGNVSVFDSLNQKTIQLKPSFNQLSGEQKRQVIKALKVGELYSELTPEEQKQPGMGAVDPYEIKDSDGRLIYTAYDGCTSLILLTERKRYSYFYNRRPSQGNRIASQEDLRNTGQPFWRNVKDSIESAQEQTIRLVFWNTMGYDKANQGWWIAWVPEIGRFEINVANRDELSQLDSFWAIAPKQYSYQVLLKDGTLIHQHNAL